MTTTEALDELYAELPTVECQGKCWHECTTVPCSNAEMLRAMGLRIEVPELQPGGFCPYLDMASKRCTVHAVRPMLCRLWGVTEGMKCPHGCKPSPRYLTVAEQRDYIEKAMEVGRT